MMRLVSLFPCILCFLLSAAQDSTADRKLYVSGFLDLYCQYDDVASGSNERPLFIYNHKRTNTVAVNLALLQLDYRNKKLKTKLGLMAGDYSTFNLAAEKGVLQHIYEASVGYAFSEKISLDAGIFPSHIGSETAISSDCWSLSRSLVAENSPYFETGLKLNYMPNGKWTATVLVLNGWQNINETNSAKAIGTQVQFKPNAKWLLNSSGFIGNEQPDSSSGVVRLFHNFYVTYAVSSKLRTSFLFDVGSEKKNVWWGTAMMLQYSIHSKINTSFRAEYYHDNESVIVKGYGPGGFQLGGLSGNLDFRPFKFLQFRAEAKYFRAVNAIFMQNGNSKRNSFSVLFSTALSF